MGFCFVLFVYAYGEALSPFLEVLSSLYVLMIYLYLNLAVDSANKWD